MLVRACLVPLFVGVVSCATAASDPEPVDAGPTKDVAAPDSPAGDSGDPDTGTPDSGSSGCANTFSGTLGTFDFTTELGSQASTASKSAAPGVTVGSISRSGALTAVAGAGSINASNWATASQLDATRYFTFTLTPDPACALDLTTVTLDTKASGTGPVSAAIATSADGFKAAKVFAVGGVGPQAISVTGANGAVEVRIYGYSASATGGTMRIQGTLTVAGALK
jgi:hypothetical protein